MKIYLSAMIIINLCCFAFNVELVGQTPSKPNIVLILADDVGYEIPGYTGGTSYDTPNIDSLAETGLRFTHCYSTPKCAPSRVKIMTGRYMFRTTEKWGHIPETEITFGHVLKEAGYTVALAGKWQMALLGNDPLHVRKMGFDQFSVFGWHEGPRYFNPYIWQNGVRRTDVSHRYGPDVFLDFLIEFISENRNRPFFAYYPMALAHDISNDFQPPPPPAPNDRYQSYRELVEYMDKNVGRLVAAIDSLGLRDKTLILFTSDNGTPQKFITSVLNGQYIRTPITSRIGDQEVIGGKSLLTDGGTHVPFIANWPGKTPAGKICSDLIDFSDFFPTLAELAGGVLPLDRIIDGHSFASQIRGNKGQSREWIYNQFEGNAWIRNHRWKLYTDGRLYDMTSDPLEQIPILVEEDDQRSSAIRQQFEQNLETLRSRLDR
jgi:arylsulfatase A-like enzyme